MLDTPEAFAKSFRLIASRSSMYKAGDPIVVDTLGELYCPPCGGPRRVAALVYQYQPNNLVLAELICSQCDAAFVAVWQQEGKDDSKRCSLALLPRFDGGGVQTPHTPKDVAYYLGQASLAQSVGAYSAAVAMYRAAVENVLLDQGYTARMLGPKLAELEEDIKNGSGKTWTRDVDTGYLTVLKELGNGSIHGGDSDKQAVFDSELLARVSATVAGLLFLIYEVPHKKAAHLSALNSAVAIVRK